MAANPGSCRKSRLRWPQLREHSVSALTRIAKTRYSWRLKKKSIYGVDKVLLDPQHQNVIYLSTAHAVLKSTDSGDTFHHADHGLPDDFIKGFTIDPANGSNVFVGTQSSGIYRTVDAG